MVKPLSACLPASERVICDMLYVICDRYCDVPVSVMGVTVLNTEVAPFLKSK